MVEQTGWGSGAVAPKVWVPEVDKTVIGAAGVMRGGALIVSVLGAEAPPAGLPQWAFFNRMPRFVSAAIMHRLCVL